MDDIGQIRKVLLNSRFKMSPKCVYHRPDGSCFPCVSLRSFSSLQNIEKKVILDEALVLASWQHFLHHTYFQDCK